MKYTYKVYKIYCFSLTTYINRKRYERLKIEIEIWWNTWREEVVCGKGNDRHGSI